MLTLYQYEDFKALIYYCKNLKELKAIENPKDYIAKWFFSLNLNPIDDIQAYANFHKITFLKASDRLSIEAINTMIYYNNKPCYSITVEPFSLLNPYYIHAEEHYEWFREYYSSIARYIKDTTSDIEYKDNIAVMKHYYITIYSEKNSINKQIYLRKFIQFCSFFHK